MNLQQDIEDLYNNISKFDEHEFRKIADEFTTSLNLGIIRAAEPTPDNSWKINLWVKQGILLLFKYGKMREYYMGGVSFYDKDTLMLRNFESDNNVRLVPGGSAIRSGCYVAPGVVCMPPMYINIGSYVDENSMIDSHALVGTCAQIGKRVHVSAAAQIGGVLEPIGSSPVIIEDDVLVGGNCGVYEGTLVRKRAVLSSGLVLTASSRIYDLVNETVIKSSSGNPLEIPEGAVVVSGSRAINTDFGRKEMLSISTPIIVKYRDEKTDAKTALEDSLRIF